MFAEAANAQRLRQGPEENKRGDQHRAIEIALKIAEQKSKRAARVDLATGVLEPNPAAMQEIRRHVLPEPEERWGEQCADENRRREIEQNFADFFQRAG